MTSTPTPTVSVVIPTHNRCHALRRTINSLALQNYSPSQFEVIVVADGCSDATLQMLHGLSTPFSLNIVEQGGSGAAKARNFGASRAKGRLLLFVDDDIEATPSLVEGHASVHQTKPQQVVMGYLPPQFDGPTDFFHVGLRSWWEEQFFQMGRPDHRFTYRDLLSGNFSLEAELFRSVGGFSPDFRCREDYELGYRLIKSNARFAYASEAKGFHYDISTLPRACDRVFQEGVADVAIGRKHPELRAPLLFYRMENFVSRAQSILFRLAFDRRRIGNAVASFLARRLYFLEKVRRRELWRETFNLLRHYWYWCGVAGQLGKRPALATFLQSCPLHSYGKEIEIDLRDGLKRAESEIDMSRPNSILLRYGETFIGSIPHEAGAEPLRGVHLRAILAKRFSHQLLSALALEQAITSIAETSERKLIYAAQSC